MVLTGPYGLSSTVAATDGPRATDCGTDTFTVTNPGGATPPIICGYNTGQHMFVPASDQCNIVNIDIDTGSTSTTRKWQIKVGYYYILLSILYYILLYIILLLYIIILLYINIIYILHNYI